MRNLFSCVLAIAGLVAATPVMAQDGPKVAYIDSRKLFAEAPGAQEAQSAFEREMAGYQSELKTLEDEIKTMLSEYEQQQVMLSPDAKRQREDAIRQKQQAFQERATQLEQQAARRQAELVEPIMQRIQAVIDDIRREQGYAMIFDAAAGALIAADTTLDITNVVLSRLNATARQP